MEVTWRCEHIDAYFLVDVGTKVLGRRGEGG